MTKACSVARGAQAVANRSVGDDSMPGKASVFAVLAPAVKLFSNFPGEAMGRLLILGLQTVAVDLLTKIVIEMPA